MPDNTPSACPHPAAGPTLALQFTPVPREKERSNGWKPEVQRAFIAALAETGSVRAACRRVGRSEHGAYQLRCHPAGEEFRAAWQAALDLGIQRIEDIAMDRAINGVEEPVYSYGKLVGTRIKYNDRLLMFILRNRAGSRFAASGKPDNAALAKLKQQWRQEWNRELDQDEQETLDSIDAFLDNMVANRCKNTSPRARAAYEEYQRILKEDGVEWMLEQSEAAEDACPEPGSGNAPALPAPGDAREPDSEPAPPQRARIMTLKGKWD